MEDLLINRFGVTGLLLILLVAAFLCIYHQRGLINVLKERVKLSEDRFLVVEERARVVCERNILSEERTACGKELLDWMCRAKGLITKFAPYLIGDSNYLDILVVEDERALHSLAEGIEAQIPGARVRLANNGAEALAAVMSKRPDLVITDLVMPVMDGFQLLERLRLNYPQIPVLVISAYFDNPAEMVARTGGLPPSFEFLPKPTTLALLLASIERLTRDLSRTKDSDSLAI